MIQDTSMRGPRLGALSYERDDNVEPAERCIVRYECEKGHATLVPFSVEAEDIPLDWTCRCGRQAHAAHSVPNMAQPDETPLVIDRDNDVVALEAGACPGAGEGHPIAPFHLDAGLFEVEGGVNAGGFGGKRSQ